MCTGVDKFLGPKIWPILPNDIKNIECSKYFKPRIRLWKQQACCSFKIYVAGTGFVEVSC